MRANVTFSSWPAFALVDGVNGGGRNSAFLRSPSEGRCRTASGSPIVLPPASEEEAADDAFERMNGPLHEDRASSQEVGMATDGIGHAARIGFDDLMFDRRGPR
jgi:hypothetical protein